MSSDAAAVARHLIFAPMSFAFEALCKEAGSMQLTKLEQICARNCLQFHLQQQGIYYPVSKTQG